MEIVDNKEISVTISQRAQPKTVEESQEITVTDNVTLR